MVALKAHLTASNCQCAAATSYSAALPTPKSCEASAWPPAYGASCPMCGSGNHSPHSVPQVGPTGLDGIGIRGHHMGWGRAFPYSPRNHFREERDP